MALEEKDYSRDCITQINIIKSVCIHPSHIPPRESCSILSRAWCSKWSRWSHFDLETGSSIEDRSTGSAEYSEDAPYPGPIDNASLRANSYPPYLHVLTIPLERSAYVIVSLAVARWLYYWFNQNQNLFWARFDRQVDFEG